MADTWTPDAVSIAGIGRWYRAGADDQLALISKEVIPSTPVTAITCLSGYDLVEIMLKGLGGDTYTIRAHASAVLTVSRG